MYGRVHCFCSVGFDLNLYGEMLFCILGFDMNLCTTHLARHRSGKRLRGENFATLLSEVAHVGDRGSRGTAVLQWGELFHGTR